MRSLDDFIGEKLDYSLSSILIILLDRQRTRVSRLVVDLVVRLRLS